MIHEYQRKWLLPFQNTLNFFVMGSRKTV